MREANVILARCDKSKKSFGIRIEKKADQIWYCDWAFKISEKGASNEGYGSSMISGKVSLDGAYPGCPYCGTDSWVSCAKCGKLTCCAIGAETSTCAWCGHSANVVQGEDFKLTGGGY